MVEEERAKMQNGEIPASDDDDDFDKAVDLEDTVDADFTDTDSEEEKAIEGAGKAEEARLAKAERRQKRKASKQRMIVPRFASASASAKTKKGTKTAPLAPQSEHDHKPSNGHTAKRLKILEPVLRASNRSSAVRKAMETEALEQEREAPYFRQKYVL
ncbi:hypothetical protein GGI07_002897 [Coemansia sp. Benny D115]|nr:hypothetical protein GGI07_002897 [Coemansia sp. Benny D115]